MDKNREVLQKIKLLQRLYKTRNTTELEQQYDTVFSKDAIIIGTSLNELCTDKPSILRLFQEDVKGWGDVRLDVSHVEYNEYNSLITASLPFYLSQSFSMTDKRFDTFANTVIPEIHTEQLNPVFSALEQSFLIHHILLNRDSDTRQYEWIFHLDIIFEQVEEHVLIKSIMFSYPFDPNQFDVVLGCDSYNDATYEKEINRPSSANTELKKTLEQKLISDLDVDQITIQWLETIPSKEQDVIVAIGEYQTVFDYDSAYKTTMQLLTKEIDSKMKLFHVMQSHLWNLRMNEIHELHIPFRVIAIISKQNVIETYILSYPYQMILENKSLQDIQLK